MTTYQDIVDYLNENYWGDFKIVYSDPGYTINEDDGDHISIIGDYYTTTISIDKGLSKLLTDLLDTPIDKRFKSIEHKIDPVNSSDKLVPNLLATADQVIHDINSFIVRTKHGNPKVIMFINTDLGKTKLNEIFKLYKDYNIKIYNHRELSPEYDLLIEPK